MFELNAGTDVLALQSFADMAELHGRRRYRSRRRNVCLVTANHSLNGVSILNLLNGFGGW